MGGGYFKQSNQLERFTKKRSKKIIYSLLGILLIIGSFIIYKAYAFYEEKKSFNVLKGRIPDFGYDIKMLSVVVDDKKSETIPERGMYKTNVHCTNGTFGEWDYNNWNLTLNNVSSESKCNITFTSGLSESDYNKYIEAGKALHRNTYRGKDITSYYNDGSLYTRISNGSFEDIYVGDYIEANGVTWLIADIDNYLYSGDTPLTKHHATIIPALPLLNVQMNETGTTEGGYINSKLVKDFLPTLVANDGVIGKTFGSHVLEYKNFLTNHIIDERPDGATWYTRKIDLMSEMNVFGGRVLSSTHFDTGIDHSQYALFQLKPEYINSYKNATMSYYLKDIANARDFSYVHATFGAWYCFAAYAGGVRPRFLID